MCHSFKPLCDRQDTDNDWGRVCFRYVRGQESQWINSAFVPLLKLDENMIDREGRDRLWGWFSLSYASFLTLPRVLMHEMPDDWQGKMVDLLREYDEAFPNQPDIGTRVQATRDGKLVKFPEWILNYRHPRYAEIEKLKKR